LPPQREEELTVRLVSWLQPLAIALSIVMLLGGALRSSAGVPEPDLVYFGTVRVDDVLQTAGGPTSLEMRKGTQVLPISILPAVPDPLHVARIGLESGQGGPSGCNDLCVQIGERAALCVLTPSGDIEVAELQIGARGRLVRMDLDASTVSGSSDVDLDGVPDFRDVCIGAGLSNLDLDGNGIGDDCESFENPGLSFESIGHAGNVEAPSSGECPADWREPRRPAKCIES
jgi:hypothetical protein